MSVVDRNTPIMLAEKTARRVIDATRFVEEILESGGDGQYVARSRNRGAVAVMIDGDPVDTDLGMLWNGTFVMRDIDALDIAEKWDLRDEISCFVESANETPLLDGYIYWGHVVGSYDTYGNPLVVVYLPPWTPPRVVIDCINGLIIKKYIQHDGTLTDNLDGTNNP